MRVLDLIQLDIMKQQKFAPRLITVTLMFLTLSKWLKYLTYADLKRQASQYYKDNKFSDCFISAEFKNFVNFFDKFLEIEFNNSVSISTLNLEMRYAAGFYSFQV